MSFQRDPYALARPSFPIPIKSPPVDPAAQPLVAVSINCQWYSYILGALKALTQESAWNVQTSAELELAIERAWKLIGIVTDAAQVCGPSAFDCDFDFTSSDFNQVWNIVPVAGVASTGTYVSGAGYEAGITGFLAPLYELDLQGDLPDIQVNSLTVAYDAGGGGSTAFVIKLYDPLGNVLTLQTDGTSGVHTFTLTGVPFFPVRKVTIHTDGSYPVTLTDVHITSEAISSPCQSSPFSCFFDFGRSAYSSRLHIVNSCSTDFAVYTGISYDGVVNPCEFGYWLYIEILVPSGIDTSLIAVDADLPLAGPNLIRAYTGPSGSYTEIGHSDGSSGRSTTSLSTPLVDVTRVLISWNEMPSSGHLYSVNINGSGLSVPC